jgi:hypothetical protein
LTGLRSATGCTFGEIVLCDVAMARVVIWQNLGVHIAANGISEGFLRVRSFSGND